MQKTREHAEKRSRVCRALFFVFLFASFAAGLLPFGAWLPAAPDVGEAISAAIVRALAAAAILFLLCAEGMLRLRIRLFRAPIVFAAVGLAYAVAVNNFPFEVAFFSGVQLHVAPILLLAYLFLTLSTAVFEEALFRGLLFPLVRARMGRTLRGELGAILSSSAIFGLLHLVNLLEAPLPDTLLQVGYTFLIGILSSLLYLFTDSLLPPILFHAIYNFGGLFLPTFGVANRAPVLTVLVTVLLSLSAAAVSTLSLLRFTRGAEGTHPRA